MEPEIEPSFPCELEKWLKAERIYARLDLGEGAKVQLAPLHLTLDHANFFDADLSLQAKCLFSGL